MWKVERGVERCDSCQYIEGWFDIYCECEFKKIWYIFLNSHFPNIISTILSFSKLLPENPRIHADSRTFKNIQGFVNTLDILESSWICMNSWIFW